MDILFEVNRAESFLKAAKHRSRVANSYRHLTDTLPERQWKQSVEQVSQTLLALAFSMAQKPEKGSLFSDQTDEKLTSESVSLSPDIDLGDMEYDTGTYNFRVTYPREITLSRTVTLRPRDILKAMTKVPLDSNAKKSLVSNADFMEFLTTSVNMLSYKAKAPRATKAQITEALELLQEGLEVEVDSDYDFTDPSYESELVEAARDMLEFTVLPLSLGVMPRAGWDRSSITLHIETAFRFRLK
tara:strand:+ start:4894 stop:5622 length:729 start_codon:yes stop_codon:yes gene_type:complete